MAGRYIQVGPVRTDPRRRKFLGGGGVTPSPTPTEAYAFFSQQNRNAESENYGKYIVAANILPENSGKKSLVASLVQQPEDNRAFIQYYSFSQTPSRQDPDNGTLFGAVADEFAYSDFSEVDLSSATTLRAFLDMIGQTAIGQDYEEMMLEGNNLDSFIEATEAVAQVNANSGSNYRIAS